MDQHTHDHHHADPFAPRLDAQRIPRIGIGGPVGSGKTALVAALCRALGDEMHLAVVTNDIYTTEDADFLLRNGVLPADRIRAVETGCCPHTAVRDDPTLNLAAAAELEAAYPDARVLLLESGGDNLTLTFSRALVDFFIFVIDVSGGDKIPRKRGPGISTSDLLVINKIDLAPYVGASLEVMERDSRRARGERPFVFTNCATGAGVDAVLAAVLNVANMLQQSADVAVGGN